MADTDRRIDGFANPSILRSPCPSIPRKAQSCAHGKSLWPPSCSSACLAVDLVLGEQLAPQPLIGVIRFDAEIDFTTANRLIEVLEADPPGRPDCRGGAGGAQPRRLCHQQREHFLHAAATRGHRSPWSWSSTRWLPAGATIWLLPAIASMRPPAPSWAMSALAAGDHPTRALQQMS